MSTPDSPLLRSLLAAVEAAPDDVPLRLHVAEQLLTAGRADEATVHIGAALQREPGSGAARALMARVLGGPTGETPAEFDWKRAEQELGVEVPPRFTAERDATETTAPVPGEESHEITVESVRLSDVAGMERVKERLETAFLAPMRNERLRRLFGKSLRGGLLLYGPPGCGKTFIARAVAGELGAGFMAVSIADVLDMWIGNSEKSLAEIFATARRNKPCVLFFDELDGLGGKRARMHASGIRNTVTQLLTELDSVASGNDGVFVLAATNHPWDIDSALRRPGRLDRTILVLPPDAAAREALLRSALAERPIAGIDLPGIVAATEGFSGADLVHLCDSAAEKAMIDSIRDGEVRMIEMRDFTAALGEVASSVGPWFDTARNVAMFANEGGVYDELVAYMKKRRQW
ncbi:tetratricopeptide repeat protein [Phytomonospora endophytica]|uniref:SpoVK/Ycf46/Vps4 family AAA+-type ATPase n=1 Tax=Phytomonospora endophytica TaxID=714109 RepID=A0A841FPY8_9ACTN|nr:tetratricopeptide repeat protein [Phytomonospora endophytica]MBB6035622.1 SpoVK/Ycf46/Vps4 family AAA+-type ATPase [Phytomonospora endophytica]